MESLYQVIHIDAPFITSVTKISLLLQVGLAVAYCCLKCETNQSQFKKCSQKWPKVSITSKQAGIICERGQMNNKTNSKSESIIRWFKDIHKQDILARLHKDILKTTCLYKAADYLMMSFSTSVQSSYKLGGNHVHQTLMIWCHLLEKLARTRS